MTHLREFPPLLGFLLAVQLPGLCSLVDIRCSAGEYLHGDTCRPCEPRTFMPDNNHQHTSCINCNRPKPGSAEVVLEACTPTSDTKLDCSHGYYRMERGLPHQWACLKLTDHLTRQEPEPPTRDGSDDPMCFPHTGAGSPDEDQSVCRVAVNQVEDIGDISILCHRGYYLAMSDTGMPSCLPCPAGTFMPDELHSFQVCRKCAQLEPGANEIIVSCTSTRDTTLTCETGHYRTSPETELDTACLPCSTCAPDRSFETQPCGTHSDTVCCPEESMQVVTDASRVFNCVPNPEFTRIHTGVCPAGTYLDYDRGLAQCLPCPVGSFMPVGNHVNMDCKRCSVAQESLHEVELAPCTAVTDTVIVCQEGYFMDNNGDDLAAKEHRNDGGKCEKCTVCDELQTNKFFGRNCSHDEDAVCCPEPDMTVSLDEEGRVQCLAATWSEVVIRCSKGYFLQWSTVGKPSCKECPTGTFVDMDNHNLQECIPCSKAEEFNMEIEVAACTRTSDTLILCADGHYRQRSRHDPLTFAEECTPCRNCSFEAHAKYLTRKCQNYTDTICCPENNMNVEEYENGTHICTFPVDNANRRCNSSGFIVDHLRNGSCISGEYPLFRIVNTTEVICRSCPVERNTTSNARVLDSCWNGSENGSASKQYARIPTAVSRHGRCRLGEYMYVLQRSPYVKGDTLCSWCENGTFIAKDYHNRTECTPCSIIPGKSVSKNCTRTSDTKFTNTPAPGNEHPITTAIFVFVGAVLSTVNGARILFQHLSRVLA